LGASNEHVGCQVAIGYPDCLPFWQAVTIVGKESVMRRNPRANSLKFSDLSYKRQQRVIIICFLFISVVLLVGLTYIPLGKLVFYSFTNWDGMSRNYEMVGMKNYVKLFTDPSQFAVLKVSLYYIFGTLIQTILALYFATILSFKVRFKNFFKAVIFFPYLINGVAIGFIFLLFYRAGGMLDTFLQAIGLGGYIQKWLGNPQVVNWSIIATSIWRYMGFMFVIFYGAIASIPSEVYEAADVDGANAWHKFRYIILPGIRQVIFVNLVINLSGALSIYEMPYIMTGGANNSKTFLMSILDTAFKYNKYGEASAMSVILLSLILVIAFIQKKVVGKEENEA
jgi:multiple sugar transport system permease protein